MATTSPTSDQERTWLARCGCGELLRTFRLAIVPQRWLVATLAVVLMFLWGSLLDGLWQAMGRGVSADAIALYQVGQASPALEGPEAQGVFAHWVRHEAAFVNRAAWACIQLQFFGEIDVAIPTETYGVSDSAGLQTYRRLAISGGVVPSIMQWFHGLAWLVTQRPVFAILFLAGVTVIVAWAGGGICREAAVDFARGEKLPLTATRQYVRSKALSFLGVLLFPLALSAVLLVLLGFIGLIMAIPWLGKGILVIVLFPLALLVAVFVVLAGFGLPTFGHLLLPTVAVDGVEALDAFGRAFNYVFGRPFRSLLSAAFLMVYGSLSWLVIRAGAFLLIIAVMSGVCLFVRPYSGLGAGMANLDAFQQAPTVAAWIPFRVDGAGWDVTFGLWIVRLFAGVIVAGVWGFAWSFYLCGSTVLFFLLRRDVDWTDFDEVYESELMDSRLAPRPGESSTVVNANGGGVSLPVIK